MMNRLLAYAAVAALAVFNGVLSPKAFTVFALQGIWYPGFLPAPLMLMFVLSGVITTLLHVLVTAVPVGLFEQFYPAYRRSTASALIWLCLMLIPTAMTLQHLIW